MKRFFGLIPLVASLLALELSCKSTGETANPRPPLRDSSRALPASPMSYDWGLPGAIDTLIASMTLEEKISQMVMVRSYAHYFSTDTEAYERLVRIVTGRKVGGIIMAQGDVYEEAVLLNRLQRLARIPLLIAGDFERGIAMRVRRGTSFPDAMAVGATRKPDLAYKMGKVVANEARAIGVHQNYAPVADINTNPLNPAINTRAYGDDQTLVRSMVSAFVRGTADGGGIATAKHFPGHGATGVDSHLGLPVLDLTRARLDSVELRSFRTAIESGARSVMIGHLAVPVLDSLRLPASLSHAMIEGVLRKEMGFGGLVVTDAMEMQGVTQMYPPDQAAVLAVRAGVDLLLVPPDPDVAVGAILRAVQTGEIPESRINASVRRIVETKRWLGLDKQRLTDIDAIAGRVGTRANRGLAREIARDAMTVVRNTGGLLPLIANASRRLAAVLLSDTDDNRTDVGRASSPWSTEPIGTYFSQLLQRRSGNIDIIRLTPTSTREECDAALVRMRSADVAIIGAFVKVRTSSGSIVVPDYIPQFSSRAEDLKTPLVVCVFGSPYVAGIFPKAQAILCAYGDNEALSEASAEALFGEIPIHGKLPVSIPGKFSFGSGIQIPQSQLRRDDPAMAGFDTEKLSRIDAIVNAGIADSAFPGAQVAILKDGMLVYEKSFGSQTYERGSREVDPGTMYDLASLTKVVGTTTALMKLYDQRRYELDDPVGKYLPEFSHGEKAAITIRHLLLHRGGFPPFRQLWTICPDSIAAMDTVFATSLVARPGDSTIYSDLGVMTLGKLVEKFTGTRLDIFLRREFFDPLRMSNTTFVPDTSLRDRIAPTELDNVWRKRVVRGTVHDENAAFLGGVSGHAGLFSTASDLAIFMQMLLNKGVYAGRRYISEGTLYDFISRTTASQERWLGWDMRSPRGSSAGTLFSLSSFGHTGFTGTSIWADPERNLAVIFLTNRVYPSRANTRLAKIRPALHDAVIQALGYGPGGE